jgi:hypothetical protein
MPTGFEGVGLKALIDALVSLFGRAKKKRMTTAGRKALEGAMKELLMAPTDLRSAEAKLHVAKAAGIISEDVVLAEDWVGKHKAALKKPKAPAKFKAAAKKKRKAPGKKKGKKRAKMKAMKRAMRG